ncbi:MAG: redox-regulated ATPase YchF [Candidatus Methanomethylicota archaeon]|uniref:Redox-regulated ATPase YchF n=1 Tax=Thermoproteota archaeon TaxID=2056631 RepID=A0A497ETP3_9CREN|nr:MAG: redox-regulated ATPase YchF [Candidatus Verstraetearchaeota archaeon]
MQLGIVGKTNVGKTTFFCAATLAPAKIASYPFTTIEPNRGIAYVQVECVCKKLGVRDNPVNSMCIDGIRYVPVELVDVAGLVPDAWKGRGLGNKFLDDLRQADALIHVLDVAGATDINGTPCNPGMHDPAEDVVFLEKEIDMWIYQILKRDWDRLVKAAKTRVGGFAELLSDRLSGLSISRRHVVKALQDVGLDALDPSKWCDDDLLRFVDALRKLSKPMLIAANKIDLPTAEENIKKLRTAFPDKVIIPCSAEAELALRQAAQRGLIRYRPGDKDFEILKPNELTEKQLNALKFIKKLLEKWGSTGVQEVINTAYLKLLDMIPVFPVEDVNKLTDHHGNVLPDVYLVPRGTTARQLAYRIHSDLGDTFLYAINAVTGERVGEDYVLKEGDVIKVVATKAIKSRT